MRPVASQMLGAFTRRITFPTTGRSRNMRKRGFAVHMNREHRTSNGGNAEWWAERSFRFGRGMGQHGAILSYEIVGPFSMNQYLLGCPDTGRAALIDTGDSTALLNTAESFGLEVTMFLQTHAHIDHIMGLAAIKRQEKFNKAPIYLHPMDLPWYQAAEKQSQIFGLPLEQPPDPEVQLQDGQTIYVGNVPLKVIHTPGHCPGHCCFYCEPHGFLIAGDLIFAGSIGRTDFPMCNRKDMKESLRRIMELPDETKVFPGHMQPTTIGRERRHNPFL